MAMRMRRIIVSPVVYPVVPNFSKLSHKWHDFLKNVVERKMCFDFLYNFCLKYFSY
jgi:hypothetical protein